MIQRIFFFVALALALGACGRASTMQEITIDGAEFKYQPNTIQVTVGQPVRLTFRNTGLLEHDWSIIEIPLTNLRVIQDTHGHEMAEMTIQPQLHISAAKGKTSIVEFTPTRVGTYDIVCTVPGHKEAGMTAKLVVKEP